MNESSFKPQQDPKRHQQWGKAMPWANMRNLLWLILGTTLFRLVYLILLCPIELVKDEAHYWEWSRHLAGSYYTKGPGIAWLIAGSVKLFGDVDWAVRLPAVLTSALSAWVIARLTCDLTHQDQRAGFFAGLAFLLVPAYQFTGLLMTIDGPYILCWLLAVWAFWHAVQAQRSGQSPLLFYSLTGLCLGIGTLFKYTQLLLLPGLMIYLWIGRKQFHFTGRAWFGILSGLLIMLVSMLPIVLWNQQHGWPTLSHLLGRLHLPGGDEAVSSQWSILYLPQFIGTQIGILGPGIVVAILLSIALAKRGRNRNNPLWDGQRLMLCAAVPILLLYTLIACFKPTQANWALAGYTTLLVIVAQQVTGQMARYHWLIKHWGNLPAPRPKKGYLRAMPETGFQIAWQVHLKWGIGAAVVILCLPLLAQAPFLSKVIPAHRFEGKRQLAMKVQTLRQAIREETGTDPILISDHYGDTSLLAFYLPGHPVVHCAGHLLGRRMSAYDFFEDNDLADAKLHGRTALLINGNPMAWQKIFLYSRFATLDDTQGIYKVDGYAGLSTASIDSIE